jgi:hypothetical protein
VKGTVRINYDLPVVSCADIFQKKNGLMDTKEKFFLLVIQEKKKFVDTKEKKMLVIQIR